MIDLYRNARPDELFHLQAEQPVCDAFGVDWLYRVVKWTNLTLPDGGNGAFYSCIVLWVIRWYKGTAKCDGSRTYQLWAGYLGTPFPHEYVITTTPKELFSVRLRWRRPDRERFDNMGGI